MRVPDLSSPLSFGSSLRLSEGHRTNSNHFRWLLSCRVLKTNPEVLLIWHRRMWMARSAGLRSGSWREWK